MLTVKQLLDRISVADTLGEAENFFFYSKEIVHYLKKFEYLAEEASVIFSDTGGLMDEGVDEVLRDLAAHHG